MVFMESDSKGNVERVCLSELHWKEKMVGVFDGLVMGESLVGRDTLVI